MRRLRRILTIISLVLCLGVCAMWVRSAFREDTYGWYSGVGDSREFAYLSSGQGGIFLIRMESQKSVGKVGFHTWVTPEFGRMNAWDVLLNHSATRPGQPSAGFWRFERPRGATVPRFRFWGVPYWLAFALTALAPGVAVARWYRARALRKEGICPTCGEFLGDQDRRCPCCDIPTEAGT